MAMRLASSCRSAPLDLHMTIEYQGPNLNIDFATLHIKRSEVIHASGLPTRSDDDYGFNLPSRLNVSVSLVAKQVEGYLVIMVKMPVPLIPAATGIAPK